MPNDADTYTTEAIACGLSDVAGWLENEGGRDKHARTIRLGVERLRELGVSFGSGSREPGPTVPASGFDPSRTGLRHYSERIGFGGQLGIIDRQFGFVRCILPYDYKYTCNAQQWREAKLICEALEGPMESLGVFDLTPAQGTEAEGRNTEGGSVHEGPVSEADAPSSLPHPQAPNTLSEVEEAKARLAELDCLDGSPASHVERLRCRASAWAFAGNVLKAKQADAKADRIEAALATLRASQEQDSEVRS